MRRVLANGFRRLFPCPGGGIVGHWPGQVGGNGQRIHIFKLDLQQLTESGESVRRSAGTCLLLCVASYASKLTEEPSVFSAPC